MGTISTVAREDLLSRLRKLPIQTVCLDEAQVPLKAKISQQLTTFRWCILTRVLDGLGSSPTGVEY